MDETPKSLLERVRSRADAHSWDRLVALYRPFLVRLLRQYELTGPDLDDLLQDIFVAVIREIPVFQHNRQPGAFRRWLRLMVVNRVRGYWRSRRNALMNGRAEALDAVEDPGTSLDSIWDQEHDAHVARRLLELLRPEFTESTWLAFCRQVMDEVKPRQVAAELGLTVNAVLIAKSRVLRRFREEIAGLVG
jgi:RNA polymerase sigma-70 factor (ECF subfamily)